MAQASLPSSSMYSDKRRGQWESEPSPRTQKTQLTLHLLRQGAAHGALTERKSLTSKNRFIDTVKLAWLPAQGSCRKYLGAAAAPARHGCHCHSRRAQETLIGMRSGVGRDVQTHAGWVPRTFLANTNPCLGSGLLATSFRSKGWPRSHGTSVPAATPSVRNCTC